MNNQGYFTSLATHEIKMIIAILADLKQFTKLSGANNKPWPKVYSPIILIMLAYLTEA